jgi:hypothetical protein
MTKISLIGSYDDESAWIGRIFEAIAANGGIVRRSKADVRHYASEDALKRAVIRRGFHLLDIGTQYVIICRGGGEMRWVC